MFTFDRGPDPVPEPFLAKRLEAVARECGPACRAFLAALAAAVRGARGEVDASGLDAAARAEVLAVLVSAHEAARTADDVLAVGLLRLRCEWESYARHPEVA